jgi:hypothetical protein
MSLQPRIEMLEGAIYPLFMLALGDPKAVRGHRI